MTHPTIDLPAPARDSDDEFHHIPWWTINNLRSVLDDIDTATWCLLCDLTAGTPEPGTEDGTTAAAIAAVMEALWLRRPIRHTTALPGRQLPARFAALTTTPADLTHTGRVAAAWCLARLAAFAQHLQHPGISGCRHHSLRDAAATARQLLTADDGSWLYTTSLATRYDHDRPFATPEFTDALTTFARQHLTGTTAIELGAGTGAITRITAPHPRTLTAIEPAPGMRSVLQQRTEALPHVQIRGDDCMNIDLPDACADIVYEHAALCFVDEPLFAVAETARLLRPGAAFVRLIFSTELPEAATAFTRAFHTHLRHLGHAPGRISTSGNDERVNAWLAAAGIGTHTHVLATWNRRQPLDEHIAPLLHGSYPYLAAVPGEHRRRAVDAALSATHLHGHTPIDTRHTVKTATAHLYKTALRLSTT